MSTQHEFCFFACSVPQSVSTTQNRVRGMHHSVNCAAEATVIRKRKGRLTVEHLALGTQAVTFGDKIVNLFPALQHAFNSLVKDDLSLFQLLLDLQDAIGLLRILILRQVVLQFWKGQGRLSSSPGGPGMLREEFIDSGCTS